MWPEGFGSVGPAAYGRLASAGRVDMIRPAGGQSGDHITDAPQVGSADATEGAGSRYATAHQLRVHD